MATEYLIIAYFVILVGFLLLKSRPVKSPWLFLLRSFFPNWKFFDIVGHVPHLFARSARIDPAGQLVWDDWILIYPRRKRHWTNLFHNPDTNLELGQQNLVDHFWSDLHDLPDGDDPRQMVTYAMIERLVRARLQAGQGRFSHWQFELRMVLDGPDCVSDVYTMMQSPVCQW